MILQSTRKIFLLGTTVHQTARTSVTTTRTRIKWWRLGRQAILLDFWSWVGSNIFRKCRALPTMRDQVTVQFLQSLCNILIQIPQIATETSKFVLFCNRRRQEARGEVVEVGEDNSDYTLVMFYLAAK